MTFGNDFELDYRSRQQAIKPIQISGRVRFTLLLVAVLAILLGALMGYLIF